jgi:transposase-like protein
MAVSAETGKGELLRSFSVERPPGGWGDDHYQAVAEAYRGAPDAPLKTIGQRWGVSRATASKWVREARDREHLGYPTRRGVAGATAAKSPIRRKRKTGGKR